MRIQSFKRITSETLPAESKALADTIATSVNGFAEEVVNILSGKVSISDNLNQKFKEITVELNSNGTPIQTLQFKSEISGKCKGISVEFAQNMTNSIVYPTTAPFVTFIENEGIVTIKHITGLQTGYKWKIRLLYKGE